LVRAGRGLVPTPKAIELRERAGGLLREVEAMLSPVATLDLGTLSRTFTLRVGDGFVENFGPGLIARTGVEAPGVHLRFVQKPDKDSGPLREGVVDLETGMLREGTGPELRTQALFHDRFVGVVRAGHPLSEAKITPSAYAGSQHVDVSSHVPPPGFDAGPIDQALAAAGLERDVAIVVGGFSSALALARASDLVATVPERHTAALREGMFSFAVPIPTPQIRISMFWHPRLHADPAHRWLRGCVRDACA
jgi:DNA-binding transcriptional LysR family regulator